MTLPKVLILLALLEEVTESKFFDFEFESQEHLSALRLRPSNTSSWVWGTCLCQIIDLRPDFKLWPNPVGIRAHRRRGT